MKKVKCSRNLWLFSGMVWTFTFLRNLSREGMSTDPILYGITGTLCFISAYLAHRKNIKDNET